MATAALLAQQLRADDAAARSAAAETLASMGETAAGAAAELVACCDDPAVGGDCVAALEALGPPPVDQLPAIARLLASLSGEVAYWAATLLGRVGETAAPHADALLAVALDGRAAMAARERALWAIGKTGLGAADPSRLEPVANAAEHPRLARLAQRALAR